MNESNRGSLCLTEQRPDNCVICIFGASGDLTGRKLMPSLYELFLYGDLPEKAAIVGAARTEMDDGAFRTKMRLALGRTHLDLSRWDEFAGALYYQPLVYDELESYRELGRRLDDVAQRHGIGGNRIFNLALPPNLLHLVGGNLGRAGLSRQFQSGAGWVRLVVEKPFGRDLASARELHQALAEGFEETQVFRIDHYLAKDTVQNILVFRFANSLFEPVWNRNYIDYVAIIAAESLGVEHRAGYYEQAGVLRDMFQNHMMQLLALVAAEPPSLLKADNLRDEKVKLFRSLRPFPLDAIYEHLNLGQYAKGEILGAPVPGYTEEPGVETQSLTPTFASMKVFVDNWRWQGVPFYITSGKRLKQKVTRLEVQFKEVPHSMFREVLGEHITTNRLTMSIYPTERITLSTQAKQAGLKFCLRTEDMKFDFRDQSAHSRIDAYEVVLLDVMKGDQTLFWRRDGIDQCWGFLDPVLDQCETCRDRAGHLHRYPAGSWGPQAAWDVCPESYRRSFTT